VRATSRRSPEERQERRHSNGWTTAVFSPSSGVESVSDDVTYQSPRSSKDDVNATAHPHPHSHSHSPTDSPLETQPPRAASGDHVMSIGTLLSASEPPKQSYERRGAGGHRMEVDEGEQARRGKRTYGER